MRTLKDLCLALIRFAETFSWLPPLLARLSVGYVFLESGWGKINGIVKVIEFFTTLNLPAPAFQAYLVAYTELIAGGLLIVGLVTRLASIPLIITMVVALITAKSADFNEFSDLLAASEYLNILLLLYLVIKGPGRLALDSLVQKNLV
ncbi:MAG: DoxX family protein [Chitinophagaceae bacterium]|nr:DoxX family protein [Oligoflexus sp.]